MNRDDLVALVLDAERVRDALATVKWMARGMVLGASTPSQTASAEGLLRIAEGAEGTANVLAVQLAHERDDAADDATERG